MAAPAWAAAERELLDELDSAWRTFARRYTRADGSLVYAAGELGGGADERDGVDDFYESFFNWPALYLLGGADDLLPAAKRHWEGITAQLTGLGMLVDEYERGYDWFHQGEGMLLFYLLCLADPDDDQFRARAARFADLYLGGPPGNYDPARNLIRAPHVGAGGPRVGLAGGRPYFPWAPEAFAPYGLPLEGAAGITSYDDLLADQASGRAMGEAMWERMGRGDTAVNLAATSLATNAYFMTGEERYRDWAVRYAGGWLERGAALGGCLPDNVGLSGAVGEYLGGRWYGGHYGWSWPHGLHSVGTAAVIAATNAALLSRDDTFLDLGRMPLDMAMKRRTELEPRRSRMSMPGRRVDQFQGREHLKTLLVPYRVADSGWHDFQPMQTALPTALWHYSSAEPDWERLHILESGSNYPWTEVYPFRDKEEAGHEEPWITFLDGRNPTYPERALEAARHVVARKVAEIAEDPTDPVSGPRSGDIHHWQNHNPVVTEVLTQLCFGAPQVLYNGGLLQARVRYYDSDRRRPGLPGDVASLVERISPTSTIISLVNLGHVPRAVIVQAGAFAEHRIETIAFAPLEPTGNRAPSQRQDGNADAFVEVRLAPRAATRLTLTMTPRALAPSYRGPW